MRHHFCFLLLLGLAVEASALEYEAEGDLYYWAANHSFNSNYFNRRFHAHVRGPQWRIDLYGLRAPGQTNLVIISSTNNTEMISISYGADGYGVARLESNSLPWEVEWYARFVWIALCSHPFQGAAPDLPPPMLQVHGEEHEQAVRAQWEKFPEPPCLPSRAVYFNAGFIPTPGAREGDEVMRIGPPYDKGYTNGIYEVLAETNLGPAILPTHWIWQEYRPRPSVGNRAGLRVFFRMEGVARTVRLGTRLTEFLPPMPRNNPPVVDYRLARANPPIPMVQYSILDKRWKPASDLRKLHEFWLAQRRPRKPQSGLVAGFVLMVVLPPLAFLLQKRLRGRP